MKSDLWFKKKKYGWGWTPANKYGWLVLLTYVFSVLIYPVFSSDFSVTVFLGVIFVLTAVLIFISYKKGERPSWSWGDER